jgi:hypothetical protein
MHDGVTPAGRTRVADVFALEDGLVVVRIRAGMLQTVADARANIDAAVAACGGRRRPLLVDISRGEPLQAVVRHFYTGEVLVEAFLALGLVVEASPFGRMMGNIYFRIAKPGIPTHLFTDEASAVRWLRTFGP